MPTTFLQDLSIYNAKASLAITEAANLGETDKANYMSALKSTANDTSLSSDVRLTALTALINVGNLLDKPLPPYFPLVSTFSDTQIYTGVHNDLTGLNVGPYLHLTADEKASLLNKPSLMDISWGNLTGSYTDNIPFAALFNAKQAALTGTGLVRSVGGAIQYDTNTYLTSASFSATAAGGGLTGFYPNPGLSNSAVITQALTGLNPDGPTGTITSADTILSAIQKLNANVKDVVDNSGTINQINFALPSDVFTYTPGPFTSGTASLSGSFKSQAQNKFFAGPTGGGTGQPDFRSIVPGDLPTSGATAGTYGSAMTIPVIQVDAYGRVLNVSNVTAASGGQVNTVTFAVPAGGVFTAVNGGTPADVLLGLGLGDQDPNTVWAGPTSGSVTAPGFRALVAADIPTGIPQENIQNLVASLNSKLSRVLGTNLIYMGNGSGVAAQSVVAGDVTTTYSEPSGVNTATFTIKNGVVTYDKFANVPDSSANTIRPILLGRFSAGQGVMQQMTLSGDFTLNSDNGEIGLVTPNPPALNDAGDLLTSSGANILERLSLPVDYATKGYLLTPYAGTTAPLDIKLMWGEVGGDLTYSINTTGTPYPEFVIGDNKVTLDKMQQIADQTLLGNNSGSLADVDALTATQVTAMLDQFDTTAKGLVPAASFTPASGKTLEDYFLNANGGWGLGGSGTGGSPGGTGSEIQYRAGSTTFGGITDMQFVGGKVNVKFDTLQIVDNAASPTAGVTFNLAGAGTIESWTFPGLGATFVGEDLEQTLTNKTLGTGSKIDLGGAAEYDMWYSLNNSGDIAVIAGGTVNVGKYLKYTTGGPVWEGVSVTSTANLDGGTAFQIPYQILPGQTGFITAPTDGLYLKYTTAGGFSWATAGSGSGTVTSGAVNNLAYYSSTPTGTTVSALGSLGTTTQVLHGNASGIPTWGAVALTSDVSGTLPVANGGTNGTATPTAGAVAYGTGSAYAFSAAGTAGQYLTSGGAGVPVWVNAPAATLTVGTSVIGSGTIGRVLFQGTGNVLQQSANLFWDNTNGRLAIGGSSSPSGLLQIAAGTAAVPQMVLTPSTALAFSGIVNGSLWYDTASGSNSSLTLYKDSGYTKLITKDRNPDFATTGSGILVSDNNGTLTKSADLTALGIYAQTNTITAITSGTAVTMLGTLTGSAILSTNFFAAGKTIEMLCAGTITTGTSPTITISPRITDGTTTVTLGTFTYDSQNLTSKIYRLKISVTNRTSGSNPTFGVYGEMIVNHSPKDQETVFISPASVTASSLNTSSALTLQLVVTIVGAGNSIDTVENYAYYIN